MTIVDLYKELQQKFPDTMPTRHQCEGKDPATELYVRIGQQEILRAIKYIIESR